MEMVKGCKVATVAGLDRFLDTMVARDEHWVRSPHQGKCLAAIELVQARSPGAQPRDDRFGLVEKASDGVVVAAFERFGKMAEHLREVGLAICHR